jgi:hypothetical protein
VGILPDPDGGGGAVEIAAIAVHPLDAAPVTFDPLRQNQRAGLLLLNGTVYIAWAGHCDWRPYHGWIVGYDARTLERKSVYNTTPEGWGAGIWQSGQGLVSDGVHIFAVTANGTVGTGDDPAAVVNRGESVLKLIPSGPALEVVTFFTPRNFAELEAGDLDLGSTGPLLIPDSHLAVAGGKDGRMYVVDTRNMGGVSQTGALDENAVQMLDLGHGIFGSPLFWNGPDGGRLFVWPANDVLRSFRYLGAGYESGSVIFDGDDTEVSDSSAPGPAASWPGGMLSLSADGDEPGTAILWASTPQAGASARWGGVPGVLRAFDATDIATELWNSHQDANRDDCGSFPKFAVPTVANGKVYYGSFSKRLCVYGLLNP